MGGVATPVLGTLGTINSVTRAVNQTGDLLGIGGSKRKKREKAVLAAEQAADTADLTARQAESLASLRQENANKAAIIATESAADDRKRQRALRADTGTTRARLGAQGISSADGSGEALLLGQIREAEAEKADADRLSSLKLAALSEEEEALQRRNLLDLTQQQETQRLERLARGY